MRTMNFEAAVEVAREEKAEEAAPRTKLEFDAGLVAVAVGFSLWFLCAVMVIATFMSPGLPERQTREQIHAAPVPLARLIP